MRKIYIPSIRMDKLRGYFDQVVPTFDDFQWQTNKFWFKNLFNVDCEQGVQTARKRIEKKSPYTQLLVDSLESFGFKNLEKSFINFSRGFLPIAMHVDIPEGNAGEDGWTIIIPLTYDTNIKTVVFRGTVREPIFDDWILKQNWEKEKKVNNLRKELDLSSAYYINPGIVDFMQVDGIGDWSKGNAFCFKRSQPHCSTNFKNYNIPYKDYIILQTNDKISGDPL